MLIPSTWGFAGHGCFQHPSAGRFSVAADRHAAVLPNPGSAAADTHGYCQGKKLEGGKCILCFTGLLIPYGWRHRLRGTSRASPISLLFAGDTEQEEPQGRRGDSGDSGGGGTVPCSTHSLCFR